MRNRKKIIAEPIIAMGICAALLCGCGGNTEEIDTLPMALAQDNEQTGEENTAEENTAEENTAEENTDAVDVQETRTEDTPANVPGETKNIEQETESTSAVLEEAPRIEISEEIPQEEGMLSKPSHSENTSGRDLIFIGDSRTEGIRDAVGDGSTWCCKSGMGYAWMSSTAVPSIENQIGENTAVIIMMGVNDVDQVTNYVNYINVKANEWADLGAQTYFVSVGPVEADPYVTNGQIERFNALMEANLIGVNYIDLYSHLVSVGYSTVDGTHYPNSVSVEIYNYILENLEEPKEGIWG